MVDMFEEGLLEVSVAYEQGSVKEEDRVTSDRLQAVESQKF